MIKLFIHNFTFIYRSYWISLKKLKVCLDQIYQNLKTGLVCFILDNDNNIFLLLSKGTYKR